MLQFTTHWTAHCFLLAVRILIPLCLDTLYSSTGNPLFFHFLSIQAKVKLPYLRHTLLTHIILGDFCLWFLFDCLFWLFKSLCHPHIFNCYRSKPSLINLGLFCEGRYKILFFMKKITCNSHEFYIPEPWIIMFNSVV